MCSRIPHCGDTLARAGDVLALVSQLPSATPGQGHPGFAEAFAGTIKQRAVPLPVNPLLPAHGIAAAAAEAGARLVLASADQIHAPADRGAQPPVLIEGPHGLWAAALRLR